jgi:hypothetical protein
MGQGSALHRLLRDERGSTIVEFAVVSVVIIMIMCAIIEYGLIQMTKIAIENATQQVARSSAINTATSGCDRVCQITALVQQNTHGIINAQNIVVTSEVITSPSEAPPPQPDVCLDDPSNPYPATCPLGAPGQAYINNDGVPGYHQYNSSASNNAGGSNDLVQISVFYNWQILFPILKPFFANGVYPISSTTVVRNEPF